MRIKKWTALLLGLCLCWVAAACNGGGEAGGQYTLTYTVDGSVCELTVEYGKMYRLETLPAREGYTFGGLFDAEEGGTMYVDSQGLSVEAWKEKADKRLYVRWTPRTYTLRLEYAGGVESEPSRTVTFGAPLDALPVSYKEHYEFTGWYTLPDCMGERIADKTGTPVAALPAADGDAIVLYAGFLGEALTVTFYMSADDGAAVEARYGQTVLNAQPWQLIDGKIVSVWSTLPDGYGERVKATDTLTQGGELYAYAYSPAIRFDTKGGTAVKAVVADAGVSIDLPESQKPGYRFGGWETREGAPFSASQMPQTAVTVCAVWQRTLIYKDGENSQEAYYVPGKTVALPAPSRSGYEFAGWYDQKSQKVASSYTMPDANVTLKAGWYELKETVQTIQSDEIKAFQANFIAKRYTIVLEQAGTITFAFQMKCTMGIPHFSVYSDSALTNVLGKLDLPEKAPDWVWCSLKISNISGTVYVKFYDTLKTLGSGYPGYIKDFTVSCSYVSDSLLFI